MKSLLLLLLCAGGLSAQTKVIELDSAMVAKLGQVADTATVEHFRCLIGYDHGDTVAIDVAYEPMIFYADYNNVHPGKCPVATVGTWHNHIPKLYPILNGDTARVRKIPPEYMCYLSGMDSVPALTGTPRVTMVGVTSAVMCAWIRVGDSLEVVKW